MDQYSPAPLEGLPRTLIIAGILLPVAIFLGLVPVWAFGVAGTALLFGALLASDDAVLGAFRWRQTERHRYLLARREPTFADKQQPSPRLLADAAE